jgi:hypothetical protein
MHSWHAINPAHVRLRSGLDDSYSLLVSLSVELLELRQSDHQLSLIEVGWMTGSDGSRSLASREH